ARSARCEPDPDVGDVGAGRAGDEAGAERLEESVRIVVVEEGAAVDAERAGASRGGGIDPRRGGVAGPVDAVGGGREEALAVHEVELQRDRERGFLVAPAAASAVDAPRGLPARDEHVDAVSRAARTSLAREPRPRD